MQNAIRSTAAATQGNSTLVGEGFGSRLAMNGAGFLREGSTDGDAGGASHASFQYGG